MDERIQANMIENQTMHGNYIDHKNGSPIMDDGVDVVKMLQKKIQILHMNANIDANELKINLEQSLQDDGPSNLVNQPST
jgi:hypothetical protein